MKLKDRGDPLLENKKNNNYSTISIETVEVEGQSVRASMDDDHVVELAMSISKHGLLQPIVVRKKDDGGYQLEAGFHRLAACSRLGWKEIPAHIRTDSTSPVRAVALVENIVRRDMSLDEEVKAVNFLNSDEGLSPSSICDLLGKSRGWVDQRLAIPNYPEDVKQELLDGNLSIGKAEIISKLKEDGTRALVINQVISAKLTQKQAGDLIEMYLAAPSIQSAVEAGMEKAQEIQDTTKSYRKCELCGRIRELMEIKFIAVCVDAGSCNETVIRELKEQEEAYNATRPSMVRGRTDPQGS